jgi:superfamily II DNA or RNA helicase
MKQGNVVHMSKQLRSWQVEFLSQYQTRWQEGEKSFLLEATPGAGKTTAALKVASHQLGQGLKRVVVVVPTRELRRQWATAAAAWNIQLDAEYETGQALTRDFRGVVVTYHQVANQPENFGRFIRGACVILDEIHHVGDGKSWGTALREALEHSAFVLGLSGTPFRSDQSPIPFVRYVDGESDPDFVYSYRRAIHENVCRPVVFTLYGGEVRWLTETRPFGDDGSAAPTIEEHTHHVEALAETGLDQARALRAAVSPQSRWILPMLEDAHAMLLRLRERVPSAGGLIVCNGCEEARGVQNLLKEVTGVEATLVLSDENEAEERLKQFSRGREPWIVACNMVSEGVDIPRLRVGVFATAITTKMYFRQFIGRIVRVTGENEAAYCFLPADPRLQALARECEEEARHKLTLLEAVEPLFKPSRETAPLVDDNGFRPLHSSTAGVTMLMAGGHVASGGSIQFGLFGEHKVLNPQNRVASLEKAVSAVLEEPQVTAKRQAAVSMSERKRLLAQEIRTLVSRYCQMSNSDFRDVYNRLNRVQKVVGQSSCTVRQLEERVQILYSWLK